MTETLKRALAQRNPTSYNEERNQETGVTELTTETFQPNQCEQAADREREEAFADFLDLLQV
jgi:hypothetical protein